MLKSKPFLYGLIFTVAACVSIAFEFYYALLLPFVVAVALLALQRYDYILSLIVLATPLSFNFEKFINGMGFYFPTEPLLFGLMLLFFLQSLRKNFIDKRFVDHPITIVILFSLFWLGVTTYTSTMPVVSFKFLIARLWFIIVLYFLAGELFRRHPEKIKSFVWLYLLPLIGVIIYTINHHRINDFSDKSAHWVMNPFYKDHTSYGAILAMYYPITLVFLFVGKFKNSWIKPLLWVLMVILTAGLILSYTRAAWVSLLAAAVVFVIMYLKIPFKLVALGSVMFLLLGVVYFDTVVDRMEKNNQDSSDNLSEHVESVSNISTDASNLERLNRWSCAFRMWLDKPVFGFGPGTYMFKYAPYQKASEKTIISTNHGEVGNAHSEYLGPLSESGLLGMLAFLVLAGVVVWRGVILYKHIEDTEWRYIVLGLLLGLITYFVHGVLNNYLDTDKASVPFWTFIASIVAIDLYHKDKWNTKAENS